MTESHQRAGVVSVLCGMRCSRLMSGLTILVAVWYAAPLATAEDLATSLAAYQVSWTTPSADARGSMPLGNGSTALNAWVEPSGDVVFYIARDDAFCGDISGPSYGAYGLAKVGRVRCSFQPSPFAAGPSFRQTLSLNDGSLTVEGADGARLRLWVDAHHPVIRVDADTPVPTTATVAIDSWRIEDTPLCAADTILPPTADRIAWQFRSRDTKAAPLIGLTTGAAIVAEGLMPRDATHLAGASPRTFHRIQVVTETAQTPTPEAFTLRLDALLAKERTADHEIAWKEHATWWRAFWERSQIFLSGTNKAQQVGQGYLLQRFKNACTSRGTFPIKFNGSLFTVEDPTPVTNAKTGVVTPVTPDYRAWGYQYWFQNTRPMYWPMLASGDFDLMQPLFRMYRAMLESNAAQVKEFYGHGGAYFRETAPFWGGLPKITAESKGNYTLHYYTPILELTAMMLDYEAATGDRAFLTEILLPIADAGITFFDEHFKRGSDGKLLLDPVNSIEMFWKVRDPLPDIAGLHWVLRGLLALPPEAVPAASRARWERLMKELPAVPVGEVEGRRMILPYAAGQDPAKHNSENPELYAVYPFRLFGLGKPDLEIATATFAARKYPAAGCWSQTAIQAAFIGDAEAARKDVTVHLTRSDKRFRFPAFWSAGHDYAPDEDNGGNGMHALQTMLLQSDGGKLRLLPAWPVGWDARFQLHAPGNTVVEGEVKDGKLVAWKVTPEARRADVILP